MKIIKKGIRYRDRFPVTSTCSDCGCEFEWMPTDVQFSFDDAGAYDWVNCPDCGNAQDCVPGWFQPGNLEMED